MADLQHPNPNIKEAFEDHFQASAEDPAMARELEIWMAAWQAAHRPAQTAGPEIHSFDPTPARRSVTVRWEDGIFLTYALDRSKYTDVLPPGNEGESPELDALQLLRAYRAAPKFSHDHAAIKRTVALEDQIDAFLNENP